jgi:hypothetical protein
VSSTTKSNTNLKYSPEVTSNNVISNIPLLIKAVDEVLLKSNKRNIPFFKSQLKYNKDIMHKMNKKFFDDLTKKIEGKKDHITKDNNWITTLIDPYLRGIKDNKQKVIFLRQFIKYCFKLQTEIREDLPCMGLSYFRLAIQLLLNGSSYSSVLKYLKLAYNDDKKWEKTKRKQPPNHLVAEDMSAYRVMQILKIIIHYSRESKIISSIINDPKSRPEVSKKLAILYNRSIYIVPIYSLGWKPFDILLGRNNYRATVEQNYHGALYLCQSIKLIHRKTNLAQYGIATAIISLCGSVIEGILSKLSYLKQDKYLIKKKADGRNITLGDYVQAYIRFKKPTNDIRILLLFLLSLRNQIHPGNRNNNIVLVDMVLANYVFRLTEEIIRKLASQSKSRKYLDKNITDNIFPKHIT